MQSQCYAALKAGVHTGRDPFSSSPFSSFPRLIVIAVFLDSLQNKFAEMDFSVPRHSRPKTANIDRQLSVCKKNLIASEKTFGLEASCKHSCSIIQGQGLVCAFFFDLPPKHFAVHRISEKYVLATLFPYYISWVQLEPRTIWVWNVSAQCSCLNHHRQKLWKHFYLVLKGGRKEERPSSQLATERERISKAITCRR